MKYIVTNAHQYNGTIHQDAYLCNDREEAEDVFNSFVEDTFLLMLQKYNKGLRRAGILTSVMDDIDTFKADNIHQGCVFDYETDDRTEQYHTEIFETE